MTLPRIAYLLVGAAAGLGVALWLDAIMPPIGLTVASSAAATVIQALVVLATAVLAMLATAAGALVSSDWQADVQGRQAWARLGLTPAELSLPVETGTAWDIDPRYLAPLDNEALRQVFCAHRFALPELSAGIPALAVAAAGAATQTAHDEGGDTREQLEARTSGRALGKVVDASTADITKVASSRRGGKLRVNRAVSRTRLVANSNAGTRWLARTECSPTRTTPTWKAADIIVLGSSQDDSARPLPTDSFGPGSSESTQPPSCRGPPQVIACRSRVDQTASAKPPFEIATDAPRAGALPVADPVVRDDLGQQIPACAAELDVIETYLGHLLQDLLASSTSDSGSEPA